MHVVEGEAEHPPLAKDHVAANIRRREFPHATADGRGLRSAPFLITRSIDISVIAEIRIPFAS